MPEKCNQVTKSDQQLRWRSAWMHSVGLQSLPVLSLQRAVPQCK